MKRLLVFSIVLLLAVPAMAQVRGTYHPGIYANSGVFVPIGPERIGTGAYAAPGTIGSETTIPMIEGTQLTPFFQGAIFEIPAVLQCKSPTSQVVALSIAASSTKSVPIPVFGTKKVAVAVLGSVASTGQILPTTWSLYWQGSAFSSGSDPTGWAGIGSRNYVRIPLSYPALVGSATKPKMANTDAGETFWLNTEGMRYIQFVNDYVASATVWVRLNSVDYNYRR